MKAGTPEHPKTLLLQAKLQCSKVEAVGILESLWLWCARYAYDGRISRYPSALISDGIGYNGDGEKLITVLTESGWIDNRDNELLIHDWPQHCPDYIHLKLARERTTFADGSIPKITRLSKAERNEIEADFKRAHKKRTKAHPCAQEAHKSAKMRSQCALPSPSLPYLTLPSQEAEEARARARTRTRETATTTTPTEEEKTQDNPTTTTPNKTILTIPVKGGGDFVIRQTLLDEWTRAFPNLNIQQSLENARTHFLKNPHRRKPIKHILPRLVEWLQEDADSPRQIPESTPTPKPTPTHQPATLSIPTPQPINPQQWDQALAILKTTVGTEAFNQWLRPTRAIAANHQSLTLEVPSQTYLEHISQNLIQPIQNAIQEIATPKNAPDAP